MLTDIPDFSSIRRVLVIKLRHHGDVLLTSPVFAVLKNHLPQVQIDALVYHETREMLTLHPSIDHIFTVDRTWKQRGLWQQLQQEVGLLKSLRARHYDLLIHLTEHPRGAWLSRLLGVRYSVARALGSRGAWWRSSFSHLYSAPSTPRHTVELQLDALRRLGIYPDLQERGLVFRTGKDADDVIASLMEQHRLTRKGFIHLHPTSRWSFKSWTIDKYAEMVNILQAAGEQVVITSAPVQKEMRMVSAIRERLHQPSIDLSGQLSLKQLAALTAQAKCFVGVDSVPMHIAAAMQTPTVALFGPSGDKEWGPWQVKHKIVAENHACRPCGLDGCGGGKISECLTTIPVAAVVNAIRDVSTP